MIVASAGHVDHGKTSLVRALTGVDTDSLPEEKRRGLTIEPGFAYLGGPLGEVLGFVDVPGHERFVANMLAGVAAKLASIAQRLAASNGEDGTALTAAVFREESGIGRNLTIEVLEYFDRTGLTRRKGGHRQILRRSSELFGEVGS